MFSRPRDIRTSDIRRFELRMQTVGEPFEVHCFHVGDWGDVRQGGSSIVMLSSGSDR